MASVAALDQLIAITTEVCGGKPHIAGRRITVQNIAIWHERMGRERCAGLSFLSRSSNQTIEIDQTDQSLSLFHNRQSSA